MKKISLLLVLIFIASALTVEAQSRAGKSHRSKPPQANQHNNNRTHGTPLDGGLLAILGAAGVAYYAARKKKQNPEA